MFLKYHKTLFSLLICIFAFNNAMMSFSHVGDRQINVTMRMIGHEILLCSNDTESLVLVAEKEGDRFKIEFSSEFGFNPDDLIPIISKNLKKTGIIENYLVEVEECTSKKVVYSYQIGGPDFSTLLPCRGRDQPVGCYKLFITFLEVAQKFNPTVADNAEFKREDSDKPIASKRSPNYAAMSLFGVPILLLLGLFILYIKKQNKVELNPDLISIGAFTFNKIKMELALDQEVTELTSKEADLLTVLHSNANKTLERDFILNSVWGDEGDYVGRTLDVFISKLRKKLGADPSIKIINIRGVGYKLILA